MKEKVFVTCPRCNLLAIGEVIFADEASLLIRVKVSKIVYEKNKDEEIYIMEVANRQEECRIYWEINEKIKMLLNNIAGTCHLDQ